MCTFRNKFMSVSTQYSSQSNRFKAQEVPGTAQYLDDLYSRTQGNATLETQADALQNMTLLPMLRYV